MEWKEYRYFDKATVGLAFEGMLEDLKSAPEGSIVVLHGEHLTYTCTFYNSLGHAGGPKARARGIHCHAAQ